MFNEIVSLYLVLLNLYIYNLNINCAQPKHIYFIFYTQHKINLIKLYIYYFIMKNKSHLFYYLFIHSFFYINI
jgi:hypothetical protein